MRLISTLLLTVATLASPAAAMPGQYAPFGFGGRVAPADPDAGVARLAAASTRAPRGSGHDRPGHGGRSMRNVLRSDHASASEAYAWLDNK